MENNNINKDLEDEIHEFMYNANRDDIYWHKRNEARELADKKKSDELAAENTKKIISFIQIAVLMCTIWFIYYWIIYNF